MRHHTANNAKAMERRRREAYLQFNLTPKKGKPMKKKSKQKQTKQIAEVRKLKNNGEQFYYENAKVEPSAVAVQLKEYNKWRRSEGEYAGIPNKKLGYDEPVPALLSEAALGTAIDDAVALLQQYAANEFATKKYAALAELSKKEKEASDKRLAITVEQITAAVTIIKALIEIAAVCVKLLPDKSKVKKAIQKAQKFIEEVKKVLDLDSLVKKS